MRCLRCQSENPSQAKFCLECGARLALTCPKCRIELPAGANFCPECGSTVHYSGGNFPDVIAIPLGALDDPYIVDSPDFSVWERRKHDWLEIIDEDVEHRD